MKVCNQRIKTLEGQVKNESGGGFFFCANRCLRLDFDQAINFDFKCPECGCLMEQEENGKKIAQLKCKIKEFEKRIKSVS